MTANSKHAQLPLSYQTYIFDFYGTLVDICTDEDKAEVWEKLSLFMSYYKAMYSPGALKEAYLELVREKEAFLKNRAYSYSFSHEAFPEIDIKEVFGDIYLRAGVEASEALIIHTGQFFRVLTTDYVRPYAGTTAMLQTLRERGKKIYLLSNAQRIFTEYELRALAMEKYFDDIFISSDYKVKKPQREFFKLLLDTHSIDVESALFIGNDSRTDIVGAKNVGLDTFYVRSNISPKGDSADDATYSVNEFEAWSL